MDVTFPTLIHPFAGKPYKGEYFTYKSNDNRIMYGKLQIDRMKTNKIKIQVRNLYEYKIMEDYAKQLGYKCEKYYSENLKDKKVESAEIYLPRDNDDNDEYCCKECCGIKVKLKHRFVPTLYAIVEKFKLYNIKDK